MQIDETGRLRALRDLGLLDTDPSESFDRITRMACKLFDAPIAAVSLTDHDRQWFKSRVGCGPQIPRYKAPCAEVTRISDVLVVPDMSQDCRFNGGYLVDNGVRFYAGAPLTTREGYTLGSMCVLDTQPRSLDGDDSAASLKDLAAMVMAQIELQHSIGRIDPVSGLPNRNQFAEDIADLGKDKKGERRSAVLIDLADSRRLSEAIRVLGPHYLDEYIQASVMALKDSLGMSQLYHVGPTQLMTVLDAGDGDRSSEFLFAQLECLRRTVAKAGLTPQSGMALGAVSFRLGSIDSDHLLRAGHSAAEDARATGTGVGIYCPSSDAVHQRRYGLIDALRRALTATDQLRLVYQPTVSLESGKCDGVEALLRWCHPTFGNIAPSEFIPLAEQTELIKVLTERVIDLALAQSARWQSEGLRLRLSVNVSAVNLEDPGFADFVATALDRHGLAASSLQVEFTESALITKRQQVIETLDQIRNAGVRCAIDDFGTGYSSFAYLQTIPADVVKIDRGFIKRVEHSQRDRCLVGNIIKMVSELGLSTIAEGVETVEAYDILRRERCNSVQGYFIARPLEADAVHTWVKEQANCCNYGSNAIVSASRRG